MPKISVIMPMLNAAQYLEECMNSVITQTLRDIEIIPVDAGSTDGTVELLKEYARKDDRIKIIHSDRKSVGYQYNLGIAAAQGDYIGFVESDDYILPQMYETLWMAAEKNSVDWVKAGYSYFMDYPVVGRRLIPIHEKKFCQIGAVFYPGDYPEQYTQEIFMWRGIYNRKFVQKNHILLNETPGASFQDTGFILQVYMYANRALYLDESLYCYRRDNQASSSHQDHTILFEINEVEYITDIIQSKVELKDVFGGVNYMRAMGRFLLAYNRVLPRKKCSDEICHAVERYRNYLLQELNHNSLFWQTYNVSKWGRELSWLQEGIEKFDEEYQRFDAEKEACLREGIQKVLSYKKVIVFGCGDHGSGIISLLLRLRRNEIIAASDNDSRKWDQEFMGIRVLPPKALKADKDTVVLVANQQCFCEIKAQLMQTGISGEQIWLCPLIMGFRGTNLLEDGDIVTRK